MLRFILHLVSIRNIILLGLTIFATYGYAIAVSTGSVTPILFIAILSLGILFVIKPFWGLTTALFLDLWFSALKISMFSPRTYLVAFLLGILIFNIIFTKNKPTICKDIKTILLISTLLFSWIIFRNLTIADFQSQRLIGTISQTLNPLLIGILTFSLIQDVRDLRLFVYLMAFAASISALFGIMQFFNVRVFWEIRAHLGPIIDYERVPGLAFFGGYLSYQLGSIIPLLVGAYLITQPSMSKNSFFIILTISVMTLGLLVTLSRSGIIGTFIGVFIVLLTIKKHRLSKILFFFFVSAVGIYSTTIISQRILKIEGSALARVPLTLMAVKIAYDNPFGIGRGQWEEAAEEYVSDLRYLPYHHIVLTTTSHNQFLNVLVYWGIPGLALLILFYIKMIKGINHVRNTTRDPYLQGLCIGVLGCFISYIINSSFHNSGPFVGDHFNWYIIGISLVSMKLEHIRKQGIFHAIGQHNYERI